jgi:hypothetical protein
MVGDDLSGAHTEEISRARPKQADLLIKLAEAGELYHTADSTGFADVRVGVDGHRETWPIRSKSFRRWLVRRFYEAMQGAPNSEAMKSALAVIEAKAQFDGSERTVNLRVAGIDDKLYLDLADAQWRAVEIDAEGWRIIVDPPVRFRRAAGMLPLPAPACGGSLGELRRLINVQNEQNIVLVAAWLLAALRDRGPYPVLPLTGEQGSAKSSLAALLRSLVDPNTAPLRTLPRDERDLFIAATNGHVIAIDNVSSLSPWLSDALCRLSTGGGFATRQLYSDADEVLLDAMRPIILTGIEDVVIRGDLADRSMPVRLDPILEERRRAEREIWAEFEAARPRILGTLLDAMAHGLRELPTTRLARLPRMADFALWVTACERALWQAGTFLRAYRSNREEMNETVIEGDVVAAAVFNLMFDRSTWSGPAGKLLPLLAEMAGEAAIKAKDWPATARALSGRLRRVAPNLRRIGISVVFEPRQAKGRPITIAAENARIRPSQPSQSSFTEGTRGFRDDGRGADDGGRGADEGATVTKKSRNSTASDGDDGCDGVLPLCSGIGARGPDRPKPRRITL